MAIRTVSQLMRVDDVGQYEILGEETLYTLEDNLLLFFTGY